MGTFFDRMIALPDTEADFLSGGGDVGALIRARDWTTSPLGPPQTWPQSLRTALSIMLNSKFPTCIAWGPDLISFYNDAYRPLLGTKPEALGRLLGSVKIGKERDEEEGAGGPAEEDVQTAEPGDEDASDSGEPQEEDAPAQEEEETDPDLKEILR